METIGGCCAGKAPYTRWQPKQLHKGGRCVYCLHKAGNWVGWGEIEFRLTCSVYSQSTERLHLAILATGSEQIY